MPIRQYRGQWKTNENNFMQVLISDLASGSLSDFPDYIDVQIDSVTDETDTNNDLMAPIVAKRGIIGIKTDNNIGANTFSTGEDGRFRVDLSTGLNGVLSGYLVMDDIVEPYLPKGSVMQLVFNDGLGTLKGKDITDFDGNFIRDEQKVLDIVLYCLKKTGLDLDVKIAVNLFEENMNDRDADTENCPFAQSYIKMQTFEKDYRKYEDCYTILEKILTSWNCRIFQEYSTWWIVRIPEYQQYGLHYTWYLWDGTVVGSYVDQQKEKYVGNASNAGVEAYFIGTDNRISLQRQAKSITHTRAYEIPKELPKNSNFEQGAFLSPVSIPGGAAYTLNDWTLVRNYPSSGIPQSSAYIVRKTADGYETERYVEITAFPSSAVEHIMSEKIEVCENDRIDLSFDYSFDIQRSGSGSQTDTLAFVRLAGADGTNWTLDEDGQWSQSNATWGTNFRTLQVTWIPNSVDETDWRSFRVESFKIPVAGDIYISLCHSVNWFDSVKTRFRNLKVDFKKYIDGSYLKFDRENYIIEQTGSYAEQLETESYLADGPCFEYFGALLWYEELPLGASAYRLTSKWNDWGYVHGGDTALTDERFMKWGAYAHWNLRRRPRYIIDASFSGLASDTDEHFGLLHRIMAIGATEANTYKRYLITSMQRDWVNCTWRAVMKELYDTTETGKFGDTFTFKYKFD